MQLHGRANLEPWALPEQSDVAVQAYRYWGHVHHQLVPFFYSLSEEGYAGGGPIMVPIRETVSEWQDDWRYMLGEAFLVAPITTSTGARDVALPAGHDWYDWWHLDRAPSAGGSTLQSVDANVRWKIPLFVREGAIIPMQIDSNVSELAPFDASAHPSILVFPSAEVSQFRWHTAESVVLLQSEGETFTFSSASAGLFVGIAGSPPQTVTLDGAQLTPTALTDLPSQPTGFAHDPTRQISWVRVPPQSEAGELVVTH